MHIGVDIKAKIMKDIKEAIKEFESRPEVKTRFGEPLVGYADATSPIFDMYFSRKLCDHPKKIYSPGNTVIVHFLPYAPEIAESNIGGKEPSPEWTAAFDDSMWMSMRMNGVIRDALDTVGRLSSCTNTPVDWNEERCREEWSHKLAAYAAGMGTFGPTGCLVTEHGYAGRFGSVITDGKYAEPFEIPDNDQLEVLYQELKRQYCEKGAENLNISEAMIASCPAGAITAEGIDRKVCQAHCKTIRERIPSPEVCGKCFSFYQK